MIKTVGAEFGRRKYLVEMCFAMLVVSTGCQRHPVGITEERLNAVLGKQIGSAIKALAIQDFELRPLEEPPGTVRGIAAMNGKQLVLFLSERSYEGPFRKSITLDDRIVGLEYFDGEDTVRIGKGLAAWPPESIGGDK